MSNINEIASLSKKIALFPIFQLTVKANLLKLFGVIYPNIGKYPLRFCPFTQFARKLCRKSFIIMGTGNKMTSVNFVLDKNIWGI
jgi:hypothetical protein